MKIAFLFFFLFMSPLFGETLNLKYSDTKGVTWHRWIIVQPQDNNRTMVAVFDNPDIEVDQRFVTQVIVAKTAIFSVDKKAISKKIEFYRKFQDLKNKSNDYPHSSPFDKGPNPLWVPVKNQWSVDDEIKFSNWYKANASETAASGAGIDFDCADYALLNRWIYAHDHKLPIVNSLAGSGKLFGHFSESKLWSQLPTHSDWKQDERFKSALRYLFNSTYTHSIFNDLYPIEISKDFLTPGSVILTLRPEGSGHTQVIFDVGFQAYCSAECLSVLYGNLPAQDLAFKTQAIISAHTSVTGGFMRWRWPEFKNSKWQFINKIDMPGYSEKQYTLSHLSYDEFYDYIIDSLGFQKAPFRRAYSLAKSLSSDLNDRLVNTAMGALFCSYQYCDPDGRMFDDYSTPSKDKRFREKRDQFLRLVNNLTQSEQDFIKNQFSFHLLFSGSELPVVTDYLFNIDGRSDKMSSQASESFERRWGLEDLNNLDLLYSQLGLFHQAWVVRSGLVNNAILLCFDSNSNIICNPSSTRVKKLSTLTLDTSLRIVAKNISYLYQNINTYELSEINLLSQKLVYAQGCETNPNGYCTAFDYLFSNQPFIERMSFDPTHIYKSRMGLL